MHFHVNPVGFQGWLVTHWFNGHQNTGECDISVENYTRPFIFQDFNSLK